MKKTLYLHIGLPKTATTAIQSGLTQERNQLYAQGYCVLQVGDGTFDQAMNWLMALANGETSPHLAQLVADIRHTNAPYFILSTEVLAYLDPPGIARLYHAVKDVAEMKMVVFLRRQDTWLLSVWSQDVKTGAQTQPFDQYVDHVLQSNTGHGAVLHYDKLLAKWEHVIGKSSLILTTFEDMVASATTPLRYFLHLCQFPASLQDTTTGIVNPSPSLKSTELIRQVVMTIHTMQPGETALWAYITGLAQIVAATDTLGWNREKINLIHEAIYHKIMLQTAEGNRQVARHYLGREVLFEAPQVFPSRAALSVADLNTQDVRAVLAEMGLPAQHTANFTDLISTLARFVIQFSR